MTLTYLAVLLRILVNPLSNVFQKRLALNGQHPLAINFLSYGLLSLVCVLFSWRTDWGALNADFWCYAAAGGLVGALGNGFLVRALQHGDLSILGPINSYKSIVGLITALILLGEVPSVQGMAGVVVVIVGSYFIFETTEEGFSWRLLHNHAIRFRILAMIFTAVEAVLIKKVVLLSSPSTAFVTWCWFGALFAGVQCALTGVAIKRSAFSAATCTQYLLLAVCIGLMQYSTNYVFNHMPVAYALALFQLSALVSVVLGYKLFREHDVIVKLVGSAIMIAGFVMIIFS